MRLTLSATQKKGSRSTADQVVHSEYSCPRAAEITTVTILHFQAIHRANAGEVCDGSVKTAKQAAHSQRRLLRHGSVRGSDSSLNDDSVLK